MMNPYKAYIFLIVIFGLFVAALLALNPSYADFLFEENGIMDFLSIVIAALALMFALILGRRGYKNKAVWRFWLSLAFLLFLFIGDTLSWGGRGYFILRDPE